MGRGANRRPSIDRAVMSVVLDTNVISELIRRSPDPGVEAWVAGNPLEGLYFSAVSEAELRYGAAIVAAGRRRQMLISNIERLLQDAFTNRILPFDGGATRAYADLAARRRSAGRPVAHIDCQIAAIARSRGMAVATRNVRDFQGMDIEIVDPWTAGI